MSRLVQISIVRDERDVIRENLLHHRRVGVAAAAVIDNGSRDGTWEILTELARRLDMVVIRREGSAKHDPDWRTELVELARGPLEGDWIVPVDADEFWMPHGQDLRVLADSSFGIVEAQRFNVLPGAGPNQDDLGDFRLSELLVQRPIPHRQWLAFATGSGQGAPEYPILMAQVRPKVICRIDGLHHLEYGFHEARHAAGSREAPSSHQLLHFPVRSLKQFHAKVSAHARSHHHPWHLEDPARSWHLKYWNRLLEIGQLEAEYRSFFLSPERRGRLVESRILEYLRPLPFANVEPPTSDATNRGEGSLNRSALSSRAHQCPGAGTC